MSAPLTTVQRQVAVASRRLFAQTLLDCLAWSWSTAVLVAALWFLAQPWLVDQPEEWLRWAVAGGAFALGTVAAVVMATRWAPSSVEAAVEVDRRFQLKERITTSLTLAPELFVTSAGQALLADADAHAAKLHVGSRFPLRLSWTAALIPGAAALLALIALFYNPDLESPLNDAGRAKEKIELTQAKLIEQKVDNLKKQTSLNWPKDQDKSEKLEEIERLTKELFKEPLDPTNKDQVREKLQQMVDLQEKVKDRLDDLKAQQERNKEMQKKLQDMGKNPDQKLQQEGPAKGVEDALNQGDLQKAQEEMKALADKLKENKLSDEQRKQLEKQLEDMKQKLDNVADQKALKDQLQKALDDGKLSKEDFDKMMDKAGGDADKLKELKDIGKQLGDSKDALDKGDAKMAGEKLADAAKDLQKLDPKGQEMKQLEMDQQRLEELRQAMLQGLGGPPQELPGSGERPALKDGKTAAKDEKQKGQLDPSTEFRVDGTQKGGSFNKIPSGQVGGVFIQAVQDAPNAIERQHVPPDAADFLKGYYENLGGGKKK